MFQVHAPEAEQIHDLAQGAVGLEELDRASDSEQNLGVGFHVKRMDGARVFNNVISCLCNPIISAG